jgi:hypothetical protein
MVFNYVLLIVGIVVLIGGLYKLGQGQGGFSFANVMANAGIGASQTTSAAGGATAPAKKAPDWVGIAATVIGLIVAWWGYSKTELAALINSRPACAANASVGACRRAGDQTAACAPNEHAVLCRNHSKIRTSLPFCCDCQRHCPIRSPSSGQQS